MKCQLRASALLTDCFFVALIVALTLPVSSDGRPKAAANYTGEPSIQITVVPPGGAGPDRMETIAGWVSGVKSKECRVVIFCRTNTWYVQPFVDSPYTSIDEQGKWETKTHLGDEYAAAIVKRSYKPPATTNTLPSIGGDVLALIRVPAKSVAERSDEVKTTYVRKLNFSGYQWSVKSSQSRVGPGPNHFSDSPENVEVDAQGRLHLRITQRAGRWYCAEVISQQNFGYGTYRFYLETGIDRLDTRVVLGLFTWSDAPAFSHREIDIEISRWGKVGNKNGQFVVQPYTHPQNIVRFDLARGLTSSTHTFTWKPGLVLCQSLKGPLATPPKSNAIIHQHTFTRDIPEPGDENARINLWLMAGQSPADDKEVEIVISKFEFVPLPQQ